MLTNMDESGQNLFDEIINTPGFDPERFKVRFWFKQYSKQRKQNQHLKQQVEQKLSNLQNKRMNLAMSSQNSYSEPAI